MSLDGMKSLMDVMRIMESAEYVEEEITVVEDSRSDEEKVNDLLSSLNPDDTGMEKIGPYTVHFEGFTDWCKQDAEDRCNLPTSDPRHLSKYDDIYDEVLTDFVNREHGNYPTDYGLTGSVENPIFYAIFTDESLLEAETITTNDDDSKVYYFAYGHNTNTDIIKKRCPNAEFVSTGIIKNFKLVFRHFADIEHHDGSICHGVLWSIGSKNIKHLDHDEGLHKAYNRIPVQVDTKNGSIRAMTYIMDPTHDEPDTVPDWYVKSVEEGYREHGLPVKYVEQALETINETSSTGQGGGSAGIGGGSMVGGPGTYEQEFNMFKSHGTKRNTAMTYEGVGPQTITLTQLFKNNKPDRDEVIWEYGTGIWDDPFEIKTISPLRLDMELCQQYDVESAEDLFERMSPDQEDIVHGYINDPNLQNEIIVMDNGYIVDGNHRAIAAVLTKKSIKYIDISDEEQSSDQDELDL